MGAETYIRIASDPYDEKKRAPFLGRDFTYDVALGYLFEENLVLSKEEWKTLIPQNSDDIVNENPNPLNPADLITVLNKVKSYLKDKQEILPFEIELDYHKMEKEGLSCEIRINGSRCWIQGDSNVFEVSNRVKIVNYPMQPREVNLWLEVKDKIEIEGKTYYFRKITRYEKYKALINRVIGLCEWAVEACENVYWTVWT